MFIGLTTEPNYSKQKSQVEPLNNNAVCALLSQLKTLTQKQGGCRKSLDKKKPADAGF